MSSVTLTKLGYETNNDDDDEYIQYLWLVWFGGFYGISTFVGYLTPNQFLCK